MLEPVWPTIFHHSISITQFLSLITQFFTPVWHHHPISITQYFSHYLWVIHGNRCNFFLFYLFIFFISQVRSSVFFFFKLRWVWVLKKKKKHQLTGMDSQIVWKILSDGNWVMMPNRCEKLSDEWWKLSDEWWVDGNWVIKKVKPNCPLLVWDGLWPECALTWY